MAFIIKPGEHSRHARRLRQIYRLRYEEFVERLNWPLAPNRARLERDQFDTEETTYFAAYLASGELGACARLVPTTRPFMLGTIFADRVWAAAPRGPHIVEASRFCISFTRPSEDEALTLRSEMYADMADYCLSQGVSKILIYTYTAWVASFVRCGFHLDILGAPRLCENIECVAAVLAIDPSQRDALKRFGQTKRALAAASQTLRADEPARTPQALATRHHGPAPFSAPFAAPFSAPFQARARLAKAQTHSARRAAVVEPQDERD